ncbi:MAG TPA: TatD family hydrolase [Candidatus Stercoripulliclostridium merdipullorum]|uniref:TatD family hydrolase n=1 Tax=Candidatus Stercoripulliclostridium merdipullorum TaxID=2840952 RepID=A0A9D1NC18_9FIRM|nr:TatD family hydrolase [Candidatus Stercoripulliclostridium merdipullorum]
MIDTHCHLNDERLQPLAEGIVADFGRDGLSAAINVGYDLDSSRKAVEQAMAYAPVYAAVGIHPHDAKSATPEQYQTLCRLAEAEKVVAYGEIGLDFYYDLSDRDVQRKVMLEQLEIAAGLKLPVIFHVRDAYGLALELLKQNRSKLIYGGVMHCYGGSAELAKEFVRLGLHVAFGGAVTFKNAHKDDVIRAVAPERLLLETDCPYMTPVPYRGQLNLPKYVGLVAEKIEAVTGRADIGIQTERNARALFGINRAV